ncbi:hypothetical protein ACFYOK_23995 [Microbispora bryophytorum]|uniref:hypothetical protein n=1 Tax=Microbispora bryophytorum TaxID=1460882 RepID=UPI0033CC4890
MKWLMACISGRYERTGSSPPVRAFNYSQRRAAASGGRRRTERTERTEDEHLGLLDSLDAAERATMTIPYFAGQIGVPVYMGYRLSEQSAHGWDVAVALDPGATVPDEEARLLWERLDLVTSRFHDGGTLRRLAPARVAVELTDLRRTVCLDLERNRASAPRRRRTPRPRSPERPTPSCASSTAATVPVPTAAPPRVRCRWTTCAPSSQASDGHGRLGGVLDPRHSTGAPAWPRGAADR